MALPTYIGAATSGNSGTTSSATITPHASTATGDLMVMMVSADGANVSAFTTPAGWTIIKGAVLNGTLRTETYARIRQGGDSTYTLSHTGSGYTSQLCVTFRNATPTIANLVIGADGNRPVNGTTTTNVAPGITTVSTDNVVLTFSADRTTLTESSVVSISSGVQRAFSPHQGAGGITTINASTLDQAAVGTTAAVTITYPNPQASNGYAFQVGIPPAITNAAPTAAFTTSLDFLTVNVDGSTSSDSDGTIVSYSWDFGDGVTGTGVTTSHTYREPGTYTISLIVTDDGGASGSVTHDVSPVAPDIVALGSLDIETLKVGTHQAVALYKGAVFIQQYSYVIDSILSDTTFYIAHRGLSVTYPEMTQYAYDQAVAWGMKALEISVQVSSNGTFWCHHDATTTRMTGVAANVSAQTDVALAAQNNTAAYTDDPGQPVRPMVKLIDVLNTYANNHVIFIEDKTYANQAALVTLLNTFPDATKRFIWKQGGTGTVFAGAVAAGYKSWGYFYDADMGSFNAKQAQWDYVGIDFNSSDVTLTAAIATAGGARCVGHIIASTVQRDRLIGLGVKGIMASRRSVVPPGNVPYS
jgi:PKD repeat protein